MVAEATEHRLSTAAEQTLQAAAPEEQATMSGSPLALTTANRERLKSSLNRQFFIRR